MDKSIRLRSDAISFKCNDKITIELKDFSKLQVENDKFDDYYNCLFGSKYQKQSDNCESRSKNQELYLQKLTKKSLSAFDDKKIRIIRKSFLWNEILLTNG